MPNEHDFLLWTFIFINLQRQFGAKILKSFKILIKFRWKQVFIQNKYLVVGCWNGAQLINPKQHVQRIFFLFFGSWTMDTLLKALSWLKLWFWIETEKKWTIRNINVFNLHLFLTIEITKLLVTKKEYRFSYQIYTITIRNNICKDIKTCQKTL